MTHILVCLGSPTSSAAESTITCPPGTYDMLDWMTLDSDLRATYHMEGSSNPLYTNMQSGKFYWIKGGLGYPWDIQLYDGKYIYLWITELSWTVPKVIRNSPTTLICLWCQGAQPQAQLRPVPRSKLRTPIMTCTPTVRRLAQ